MQERCRHSLFCSPVKRTAQQRGKNPAVLIIRVGRRRINILDRQPPVFTDEFRRQHKNHRNRPAAGLVHQPFPAVKHIAEKVLRRLRRIFRKAGKPYRLTGFAVVLRKDTDFRVLVQMFSLHTYFSSRIAG